MASLRNLLPMLVFLAWLYNLPVLEAQNNLPPTMAPRTLDSLLQYFAYRAFVNPKTGITYNATVSSRLTGINATAMRLRSGSFRRRGVQNYHEFQIPTGVSVTPNIERLALVYHNFGNRSTEFYRLPGFRFIAPVLGLLAYDATNLTSIDVPELSITASGDPISIAFRDTDPVPEGWDAMCVRFDLQSMAYFSNVVGGNTCLTVQLGHFSIVTESVTSIRTPFSPRPKNIFEYDGIVILFGGVFVGLVITLALILLPRWLCPLFPCFKSPSPTVTDPDAASRTDPGIPGMDPVSDPDET